MNIKIMYKESKIWQSIDSLEVILNAGEVENICAIDLSEAYDEINDTHTDLLRQFTALEKLIIAETNITDLSFVRSLPDLKIIDFSDTRISDISALEFLTKLEKLTAIGAGLISDFTILGKLQNLKKLNIQRTLISDLSVLSKLKKLEMLDLWDCTEVSDIKPLVNLEKLSKLYLVGTLVNESEQLHPLFNLINLKELDVNDHLSNMAETILGECAKLRKNKEKHYGKFRFTKQSGRDSDVREVINIIQTLIGNHEFNAGLTNYLRTQGIPISEELNPVKVLVAAYHGIKQANSYDQPSELGVVGPKPT